MKRPACSRWESNQEQLWLEQPVLCHWAMTAERPRTLAILYMSCIGGTEASVAHLAATASLFILLNFRLITSKFIYFQHEARCSEHCCMHVWQSKCQWEYSLLCFGDLAYLWLDFLLVQVIAVTYFQVIWYYVTCKLEAACSPHSTEINVFSPINNQ